MKTLGATMVQPFAGPHAIDGCDCEHDADLHYPGMPESREPGTPVAAVKWLCKGCDYGSKVGALSDDQVLKAIIGLANAKDVDFTYGVEERADPLRIAEDALRRLPAKPVARPDPYAELRSKLQALRDEVQERRASSVTSI
jgi:hypothetical protein